MAGGVRGRVRRERGAPENVAAKIGIMLHPNAKDMLGRRFGALVVVKQDGKSPDRKLRWEVICDCGVKKTVSGSELRAGGARSCGCMSARLAAQKTTTHGEAHSNRTAEYRSWSHMKDRCYSPSDKRFHRYGGRGITVCQSWRDSYEAFLSDMGRRPTASHSLDRINNDGNYEPGNCRWATRKEQARNKSNTRILTVGTKSLPIVSWAEETGLPERAIKKRLRRGWSAEAAVGMALRVTSLTVVLMLFGCTDGNSIPAQGPCGVDERAAISARYVAAITADCNADASCPNFSRLTAQRDAERRQWISCSQH